MPSIEIVCLAQNEPVDCSGYSFRVEAGRDLISDRMHSSNFQKDFDETKGCIYHLLGMKGRTAYELLKKDWYDKDGNSNGNDENIDFLDIHESSFISLVQTLTDKSPVGEILFTSDYQFGPEVYKRFNQIALNEFLTSYTSKALRMNSLYRVKKC